MKCNKLHFIFLFSKSSVLTSYLIHPTSPYFPPPFLSFVLVPTCTLKIPFCGSKLARLADKNSLQISTFYSKIWLKKRLLSKIFLTVFFHYFIFYLFRILKNVKIYQKLSSCFINTLLELYFKIYIEKEEFYHGKKKS